MYAQSNDNKSLNIAMLGHKRVPSREGGIEVVVEALATRMVSLGHKVTLYNRKGHHVSGAEFEDPNYAARRCDYKGVQLKPVFSVNRRGLAAMTSSFFASICAAFGSYDIVHFHAEGSCVMMLFPWLAGKRCVATIHGLDHQRAKWGKFARAYILLGEKMAVKFAHDIIVLSENTKEYFAETYGRETVFIPNGVEYAKPAAPDLITSTFGLEKDEYYLYLGRIVPEKGAAYLIEAFRNTQTDKKLVIAGGTSDSDSFCRRLKSLAKGDDRIVFTGFVQGTLLEELYSNAYTYILPSDLEGMPLSLLEAMSYGNCCVVSDIAECVEIVEDKAILFEHGNVDSLQAELQRCEDTPALVRSYKADVAEFIVQKYNWDNVVGGVIQLYAAQDNKNKEEARV